ncbi:hypothetical protein K8R43_04545 [archaeon]|nr:hypothetical protein [archaeon]
MARYLKKRRTLKKEWLYKKLKKWNREYNTKEAEVIKDIKANKKLLDAFTHEGFLEHALRAKYGDNSAIAIGGSRRNKFKAVPPKDEKKFPDLDIVVFRPENQKTKTDFPKLDTPLLSYLTLTKLGLAKKRENYAGIKEKIKGRKFLDLYVIDKKMPEIPEYKYDEHTAIVKNLARIELKAIRDTPFVKTWEKAEKARAIVELLSSVPNSNKAMSIEEMTKNWGKTIEYHQYDAFDTIMTEKERKKLPKMQAKARKGINKKDLECIIQHLTETGALKEKNGKYSISKKYKGDIGFDEHKVMEDYWNDIKPGKRIIIKLGGGLIAPKKRKYRGLDKRVFKHLMKDIKELHEDGYEIGITIGGGKYGHRAVEKEPGVKEFREERNKMYEMIDGVAKGLGKSFVGMNEMDKKEQAKEAKKTYEKMVELEIQQTKLNKLLEKNNYFHDANDKINQAIEELHIITKVEAKSHGLKIKRVVHPKDVVYHEPKPPKETKSERDIWKHAIKYLSREGDYKIGKNSLDEYKEELEKGKNIPSAYGMVIRRKGQKIESPYKIASADNLTEEIAKHTKADKVIFVTDVNGVYTKDPKENKDAKHIPRGTPTEIKARVKDTKTKKIDVTGSMGNKLGSSETIATMGIPVHIINGKKKVSIIRALSGENVGTRILPEKGEKK